MRSASSGDCHDGPRLALLCCVSEWELAEHSSHSYLLTLPSSEPSHPATHPPKSHKMNLLCCENATVDLDMKCKSYLDPVLLSDDRVLLNLLNLEEKYMPNSRYFSCVQTDVEPRMRDSVAHWMLDVSIEEVWRSVLFCP